MSTFPPIAEYGLLSNCEQSCLVAPDGSVEWLCLPRPDSPSVFAVMIDRAAGLFRFGPSNAQVPQHRRYVLGTMVLETTWQIPTGWMTVQDFLAVGPVQVEGRRADCHRREGRRSHARTHPPRRRHLPLARASAQCPPSPHAETEQDILSSPPPTNRASTPRPIRRYVPKYPGCDLVMCSPTVTIAIQAPQLYRADLDRRDAHKGVAAGLNISALPVAQTDDTAHSIASNA
jgi:Domain of unknown function (DUF5911)